MALRLPRATRAAMRHLAGPFGVVCVLLPLRFSTAQAATPDWHGAPMHYAVNGAALPDVLRDVLAVEGLSANIGRDVKGVVNGRFDDTPGNVFTQLTEAYGLVWYFDGRAMHVATAADVRSRVIPFAPMTREAVASLLRNLDLDDARLPIRYSATTIKVAGPSRFVDAVADAIDKAQRQATVEPGPEESTIRIFPLRYAQAQDIRYMVGTQERVLPGVASLLRQLMSDAGQGGAARAPSASSTPRSGIDDSRAAARTDARDARGGPPPLPSLLGLGLAGMPPPADNAAAPLPGTDSNAPGAPGAPGAAFAHRNIVADARTNAVVISDLASMMPAYERAIAMLDQPQELVEIDALVIDVSSNAARSLGVAWGGATGRIDGAVGTAAAPLSFGAAALTTAASAASGLNLATLVGNSAQYLFAQLHALETNGQARVLSRPRVLTLNNTEAALTSRSSLYVRVAGNQAVDLYNIDTGLMLKVTPNIEPTGEARRNIRLNIQIDDGAFNSTTSVDGIPQVDKHSVVTQAIVRDGESLLIGGYQYERSERTTSKVPVLGDVPYLGALFRDTGTTHERLERLILITPRLKRAGGEGVPNIGAGSLPGAMTGSMGGGPEAVPALSTLTPPASGGMAANAATDGAAPNAAAPVPPRNVDAALRALAPDNASAPSSLPDSPGSSGSSGAGQLAPPLFLPASRLEPQSASQPASRPAPQQAPALVVQQALQAPSPPPSPSTSPLPAAHASSALPPMQTLPWERRDDR
ncbi:type III secretion system outer membrane ring subunit SctC [Paraburkholderia sp. D15]|uniref:type III secretion system outer membrane ring subunit SctC n=1 Tax=Paraburkholderia sp. D15 TaxID=2880218 RepID=UPI002479B88E|nr:type III secretion system outer membrane ring subunit SctC [Paraburkholderia sp. D15]WGS51077.1 type III secretion system outer membrane ring subunit SctC [Paraburkholderia sp. D15]